jgi:hypothetical protein
MLSLLTALRAFGSGDVQAQAIDAALAAIKTLTLTPAKPAASRPAPSKPAPSKSTSAKPKA